MRESYVDTIDTLEGKVARLERELEQSQAQKENVVERLEEELRRKGCDRHHCLLL